MTSSVSHRDRVHAVLNGQDVDRPPVSMWRHFFSQENTPERLAEAMLGFQRRFDWDFMKVNPRASYHAEGWGLTMRYDGDRPPTVASTPIQQPEDWLTLEPLDPDEGALGEQLRALEIIADGLEGQVPFLMTVFTPLSIASRLVDSEETFLQHLREDTEKVQHALEVITETFINFSKSCIERGASGLFFATTSWASTQSMSVDEYDRFARSYDLRILEALGDAEFHVLHVCRDDNMLSALSDYPVQAFNWDARSESNASLAEGKEMLGQRAVIGGLDSGKLVSASPDELGSEVREMVKAMSTQGLMVGAGCTFPPETPEANLQAIRQAVDAG